MKEKLSAMLDGELEADAVDRLCDELRRDSALRDAWETYALIGDALRGTVATGMAREPFAARLAAEPTVLVPRRDTPGRHTRFARYALSAAAGLAAVAFVGWVALPGLQIGAEVARSPAHEGSVPVAATPAPAPAPSAPVAAAQGVGDYLLAHQRFSPASAMQGVAPYVRTVADEQITAR